jgi:alpha,alpha-trehalase
MRLPNSFARVLYLCLAATILVLAFPRSKTAYSESSQLQTMTETAHPLEQIKKYISSSWEFLTRSLAICKTFEDIKTEGEPYLYLPLGFPEAADIVELQKHCPIRVARLPKKISAAGDIDLSEIPNEGVLFLPHPYVVPGGQFNEMYGWDSYFIILGLLRDNREPIAKGMVENLFFEIEHYGAILNANRTYYLTRSQPPFLTSMILANYNAEKASGHTDLSWLERAYKFAVTDYEEWIRAPHLAGDTGLSRYFDHGKGPVPEILGNPKDYYGGVARYMLTHHEGDEASYVVHLGKNPNAPHTGPVFEFQCDPQTNQTAATDCATDRVALTANYYQGDRTMRESGFDVSFRFGPFSADTHHYAPVCLNSLLYKEEIDLQEMADILGHHEDAEKWRRHANERRERMDKYLWDESRGLYFDYDVATNKRSTYEYATTFYPLWVGAASKTQAEAVTRNLKLFEHPGGLAMSLHETGAQWDFPYGWAPIHLIAIEGLKRYGHNAEAGRISFNFLHMVLEDFERTKTMFEKYDVVTRASKTRIRVGYKENVIGFGWTNGVFLELLHQLPADLADKLGRHRAAKQ